jgi:enamine deaminase RidA (YjgF/YER057c/UK114 family)
MSNNEEGCFGDRECWELRRTSAGGWSSCSEAVCLEVGVAGVADLLAARGLSIPPAQTPPPGVRLTYRRLVHWENVAYIAGHGPTHGEGWGSPLGKVGRDVTLEEAVAAAELTALNVLGTIERELGGLDRVGCWLKINGYVNAVDGFTEHATVINGFSDLIVDLYGHDLLAARTSVGVPHLPFNMPVEVDAVIAVR